MKILLVHTYYTGRGGEDIVFEQEAQLLSEHHSVKTLKFQNKTGIKGLFQFFVSVYNIWSRIRIKKEIQLFNPDVVHIHNMHFAAGPVIIREAKKMNKKVVVTLHNFRMLCPTAILFLDNEIFVDSLNRKFPWKAIRKGGFKNSIILSFWVAFTNWIHQKNSTWQMVDDYVLLTDFAKEVYKKSYFYKYANKFTIKPNFVFPNNNEPKSRNAKFLFVGRLSLEKGIIFLVDFCIKNRIPLDIVGTGELESEVKNKIIGIKNVSLLGKKSHEEILSLMKSYNALLFPSVWYEGMPMVILEAFASSLPVIGSNLGAIPKIIQHEYNGLIFNAEDDEDLSNKISTWLSLDEEQKQVIRDNAYKTYVKQYTPESNLEMIQRIYKS